MTDDDPPVDGFTGKSFDPAVQIDCTLAALLRWQSEQDELARNPPPVPEPVWKDNPAGHYDRGSGI